VKQLAAGVVAFVALGVGLLYLAGWLGAGGLVIAGIIEVLVIAALLRASTQA
jgi:hypothetical protein